MSLFLKYYVKDEDTGIIFSEPFSTLTEAFQYMWKQEDETGHHLKIYREDMI
jgi:hypothetical protein